MRFLFFFIYFLGLMAHIQAQAIYGRLEDMEKKPIENAWVSIFSHQKMIERARTDDMGFFRFHVAKTGLYDVLIQVGGESRMIERVNIMAERPLELNADFVREYPNLQTPTIADVGLDLNLYDWWDLPATDGFDFPFESGEAMGYYVARSFGTDEHLGEDWNGGKGDEDLGTPIYSVADGLVVFAGFGGAGWGNVIRIIHNTGTSTQVELTESVYAHLQNMDIHEGDLLVRGQKIGTMGNANGKYKAHLHFELRSRPAMPLGGGYGSTEGFFVPTEYIANHRPVFK